MARSTSHTPRASNASADVILHAAIAELESTGDLGFRLESVAERAGMSLGAIYHHYGDKDGLIDAARIEQFTRQADGDTAALREALAPITRHGDLFRVLPAILEAFHTAERRPLRARRLSNLAATVGRPIYAERISAVQHRVTSELAEMVDGLKQRGAVDTSADSLAIATFIQAYTVSHVVADVDADPVPEGRWNRAVLAALHALLPPPAQGSPAPQSADQTPHANVRGQATAQALLDAARAQLETRTEHDFRVDEILSQVGVSPSSLYHHFGSREGLMEATWIDWARRNADEDVRVIARVLEAASTSDEAIDGILAAVRAAQHPDRTERRIQRLMVIAAAARRPRVREEIGRLEAETNRRYRELLEAARGRGLLRDAADLSVLPVFVRAFTFGRVTNELSAEPTDNDEWDSFVTAVLERLLGRVRSA